MKKIFLLLLLTSCAIRDNSDWDSGAQKSQTYNDEQRQEQVERTQLQFPTAGRPGANQTQPY